MESGKERIEELLKQLFPICESWIAEIDGQSYFVDPVDGEEISAHYGATHMAAALILYGKMKQQQVMYDKGLSLLNSILDRWERSILLPSFHFDFNNFALCVIEESINDENLIQRIRQIVLNTSDSNHDTINWLPMRLFVNKKRYDWTGENIYYKNCKAFWNKIEEATNIDGGIEDRLPKGHSFNLQYDVATVGTMQYLRNQGENCDLSRELHFLLNSVAPDGDINYQGRGTNQIFAWGLWIYLLASSCNEDSLSRALDFLQSKVVGMYLRKNIMLNEWNGEDKYLWWDYHYCSVYCAHFLLWLVLALYDYKKKQIIPSKEKVINETGLKIVKNEDFFISIFSGRKEYLSEKGPVVSAIWTRKHGTICKGSFGPWKGTFGNYYNNQMVPLNFCGLLHDPNTSLCKQSRLIKVIKRLGFVSDSRIEPVFVTVKIQNTNKVVAFRFIPAKKGNYILNIPIFEDKASSLRLRVTIDGIEHRITEIARIKNQYGWVSVLQTHPSEGNIWTLEID